MAKASAGPAPWQEGFRRATKRTMQQQGMEWSLSSGYRHKQDWDKAPKKPKTKQVKLYNGRVVEVPDADFEDFIGHYASPPADPTSEIGQYIDKAWEKATQRIDGVGHIVEMIYSPTYQLLWVEFETDGAIVVFFRVPKEVYSELAYLATTKQTAISAVDGQQRHVLGMRFWDIIRIRGQRSGGRYRYEYQIEGSYEPKGTTRTRAGEAYEQAVEAAERGTAETADYKEDLKDFVGFMSTANQAKFMSMYKTASSKQLYKFLLDHTPSGTMPTEEELADPNF